MSYAARRSNIFLGIVIGTVGTYGLSSLKNRYFTQSRKNEYSVDAESDKLTNTSKEGSHVSLKKHGADISSDMLQSYLPLSSIHTYVCGFHFYNGDMSRQVEAHHYCTHLTNDIHQCVIYDSNKKNAKLIGVEYIISEKLFNQLPNDEKPYWHSHKYEVQSGVLVAPGVPTTVETSVMKDYVNTYGKTFHTWQIDRGDELPYGPPQLMMAFIKDGQISKGLVNKRDELCGCDTNKARIDRMNDKFIGKDWHVSDKADQWKNGNIIQTQMKKIKM